MTSVDDPNSQTSDTEEGAEEALPPLTFRQMLSSTLAAAVGVQSQDNRERGFSRGKASHFILMGVGFTCTQMRSVTSRERFGWCLLESRSIGLLRFSIRSSL